MTRAGREDSRDVRNSCCEKVTHDQWSGGFGDKKKQCILIRSRELREQTTLDWVSYHIESAATKEREGVGCGIRKGDDKAGWYRLFAQKSRVDLNSVGPV